MLSKEEVKLLQDTITLNLLPVLKQLMILDGKKNIDKYIKDQEKEIKKIKMHVKLQEKSYQVIELIKTLIKSGFQLSRHQYTLVTDAENLFDRYFYDNSCQKCLFIHCCGDCHCCEIDEEAEFEKALEEAYEEEEFKYN